MDILISKGGISQELQDLVRAEHPEWFTLYGTGKDAFYYFQAAEDEAITVEQWATITAIAKKHPELEDDRVCSIPDGADYVIVTDNDEQFVRLFWSLSEIHEE